MPGPAPELNPPASTGISADAGVIFVKLTPLLERQRPSSVSDLPADWLVGEADPHALLARIAPTQRHMERLRRAHELVGALYGPDRQRVWLVRPLPSVEATPLEFLALHGPDGWDDLHWDLMAAMQGGGSPSQKNREWATNLLAGHELVIRPSQPT